MTGSRGRAHRRGTTRARRAAPPPYRRTMRFHQIVHAPLPFVFRWCTDFREDDDRITDDIYHYAARILLREPARFVREVVVPGRDRNRCTEIEVIRLAPPDRWSLEKFSVTDDKTGRYRLTALGPRRTRIEMSFRETWKGPRPPSRSRYRALFGTVWARYAQTIEREYRRARR